MITLGPAQVVGLPTGAPLVQFAYQVDGKLTELAGLKFQIYDVSSAANQILPVQKFPASSGTKQTVDVAGVDRVGLGRYAAAFTTSVGIGRYEIWWYFTPVGGTEQLVKKEFEVVSSSAYLRRGMPSYALVADIRDEELVASTITDATIWMKIVLASRMIETITGRFFEARYQELRVSGNSSRCLLLEQPIVAIEKMGIDTEPTQLGDLEIELDMLRVYARHLSQGLIDPDDRENPRVEFVHSDDSLGVRFVPFRGISLRSLAWPIGVQNVHAWGLFGYVEPDGSPCGDVPMLIRHACKLIVARESSKLGDRDAREDATQRWRITSEKTRDQQIDFAAPRSFGGMIGDPEIDSILVQYMRQMHLGAV